MRLEKLQNYLKERSVKYDYYEDMGCGSIEFIHRHSINAGGTFVSLDCFYCLVNISVL